MEDVGGGVGGISGISDGIISSSNNSDRSMI